MIGVEGCGARPGPHDRRFHDRTCHVGSGLPCRIVDWRRRPGEPDADISGAAPDITPAIQPKAIPGQNPPATQADKQVQPEIDIPAKFEMTASNVQQFTISMMDTEMGM